MDELGFVVIIGLVVLAVPILGLVAFFRTVGQRARIDDLEGRVKDLERRIARAAMPQAAPEATASDVAAGPEMPPPGASDAPELPFEEAPVPPMAAAASVPAEPEPVAETASEAGSPPPSPPHAPATAPAKPPRSLEETIGTRWVVWVGGVALGLGGLFLVRYSIEQGWFGPGARVMAGALFAFALVAAGELLRRREMAAGGLVDIAPIPGAHIPSILTAAGTLTAFGTVYAAHALYGMIGPAVAFVLLGLLGLATMAAAALHGPALAGFGLLAAFGAPVLVSSNDPQPWPVVIYLLAVTGSAYGLARIRRWAWLAIAAAGGAALWGLLLMGIPGHAPEAAAHVALQAALMVALLVVDPHRGGRDDAPFDRLATGLLALFTVLACLLLSPDFDLGAARGPLAAGMALLLGGAGLLVAPAAGGTIAAALVASTTLAGWPVLADLAAETPTVFPAPGSTGPMPDTIWLFLTFAIVSGAVLLAAALVRLNRSALLTALPSAFYAAAGVAGPLALLVLCWWRIADLDRSVPLALAAAALAVIFVAGAGISRRRFGEEGWLAPLYGLEAFAAGAIGALALGLTIILDKGALTVALALAALGAAWVTTREALGLLRYAVGALGLVVAARLAWDPAIVSGDLGSLPILNWLLWGYGVPALAFGGASVLLRRQRDDQVVALCEALALAFAGFLLIFEIRHALGGGRIDSLHVGHLEAGLQAFAGLIMGTVVVSLEATRRSLVLRVASYVFGGFGLAVSLVGLVLVCNPLFGGLSEAVAGGALFNSLLPAYLLPALAALVLAWRAKGMRPRWFVLVARLLAVGLAVLWLVLEIRRVYQGPNLAIWRSTGDAEFYTYSAAFLLVGLALLAFGLLRGSREARLGSAVFILVAVVKAFLFDMAGLTGAYRALSFIGLGLVLVGIGLVYQKLVFRRAPAPPAPGGEEAGDAPAPPA